MIESVYPNSIKRPHVPTPERARPERFERAVEHRGTSAIVLAVNLKALVEAARHSGGAIEFTHRVGDFVATGDTLFRLYGGAKAIDDRLLRAQVALGPERTIEQDSIFAFRVIVDIAVKALSKAINDPTTAVLAIDQLHRLLRLVGARHLHDDTLLDGEGRLRLIFPTPNWDDFVQLTCREIRLYGADNFQVARRLRAMIDGLVAVTAGCASRCFAARTGSAESCAQKNPRTSRRLCTRARARLTGAGGRFHSSNSIRQQASCPSRWRSKGGRCRNHFRLEVTNSRVCRAIRRSSPVAITQTGIRELSSLTRPLPFEFRCG